MVFFVIGSDCRARTCDQSVNSRLLYHWAKSEWWRPVPELNRYKRICSPLHKPFCQPANFELPSTHSVPLYIQFFLFSSREIFRFFAHNFIFFEFIKKIKLLPFSTNILIRKKIFLPPQTKKVPIIGHLFHSAFSDRRQQAFVWRKAQILSQLRRKWMNLAILNQKTSFVGIIHNILENTNFKLMLYNI